MYLVWGDGEDRAVLGHLPEDTCPACGKKTKYIVYVDYTYCHAFCVFSFLLERKYHKACNSCGASEPFSKGDVPLYFNKDNIPFVRKNGWLLCLVIAATVAAMVTFIQWHRNARLAAAVADAKVGDVFIATINRIPNTGFAHYSGHSLYGALALMELGEDGKFLVAIGAKRYRRKTYLEVELLDGASFYIDAESPLLLSRQELMDFQVQGIICDSMDRGRVEIKPMEPPKPDRVRYGAME